MEQRGEHRREATYGVHIQYVTKQFPITRVHIPHGTRQHLQSYMWARSMWDKAASPISKERKWWKQLASGLWRKLDSNLTPPQKINSR